MCSIRLRTGLALVIMANCKINPKYKDLLGHVKDKVSTAKQTCPGSFLGPEGKMIWKEKSSLGCLPCQLDLLYCHYCLHCKLQYHKFTYLILWRNIIHVICLACSQTPHLQCMQHAPQLFAVLCVPLGCSCLG